MKTFLLCWSFASALFLIGCDLNTPKPVPDKPVPGTPMPANPAVPEALKVLPTEALKFTAKAKGVQIYECDTISSGKFGWVFKGPEAELFDETGKKIGTHYKSTGPTWAGPAWEFADGSRVIGKKLAEAPAPVAGAIPWLLLEASSFVGITKIQRVETGGGKAPEGDCDAASVGKEMRVPYTATYYFYTVK